MKNDDKLAPQIEWWQNCAGFVKDFRIAAEEIKREYWESQEVNSAVLAMSDLHEFLHRFPKLEERYTSIKANAYAIPGLYRFILSEPVLKLFLSALLREIQFDLITKLATGIIDKVVFKQAVIAAPEVTMLTVRELHQACKKLDKKDYQDLVSDNHTREELFQELLWKEAEKWANEKPYVELVQKVLEGFFTATLPKFARRDLIDENRTEHRKKRYPSGEYEYLDEFVNTDRGIISRRELLEQTEPALQMQPNLEFLNREALLAELDDEDERQIIEFWREGYTQVEISKKLRRSQSLVSEKFKKIAKKSANVE